jgi:hypothetical protein
MSTAFGAVLYFCLLPVLWTHSHRAHIACGTIRMVDRGNQGHSGPSDGDGNRVRGLCGYTSLRTIQYQ